MSGYLYTIQGIVIDGDKRGRELGYPTANVATAQNIPEGVYLSHIQIGHKLHNALTFIGAAKTFDNSSYKSETFIIDFDADIYGKEVTIQLIKFLRGNEKFSSIDDLIIQMDKDKQEAITFFKDYSD